MFWSAAPSEKSSWVNQKLREYSQPKWAHASSKAAGILLRIDLHDRPLCFYTYPSFYMDALVGVLAWYPLQGVYLFYQQCKGWNIPFLQVSKWCRELNFQIFRHVQTCKSIKSQFNLIPNSQRHFYVIHSHLDTKYARAENHEIRHLIEFLK